jgi:hypothetical protein
MNDTKIDDGGPAFPCETYGLRNGKETTIPTNGMTLRDYAIVHFIAALMQREDFDIETGKLMSVESAISPRLLATEQADAMLAARKEKV